MNVQGSLYLCGCSRSKQSAGPHNYCPRAKRYFDFAQSVYHFDQEEPQYVEIWGYPSDDWTTLHDLKKRGLFEVGEIPCHAFGVLVKIPLDSSHLNQYQGTNHMSWSFIYKDSEIPGQFTKYNLTQDSRTDGIQVWKLVPEITKISQIAMVAEITEKEKELEYASEIVVLLGKSKI